MKRLKTAPWTGLPPAGIQDIRGNIAGMLKDKDRIGLEFDVLPVNLFFRYKEMLEPLEVVDVSGIIGKLDD